MRLGPSALAEILSQLARYEQLLWSNVNPKLLWQNVAITCATAAALEVWRCREQAIVRQQGMQAAEVADLQKVGRKERSEEFAAIFAAQAVSEALGLAPSSTRGYAFTPTSPRRSIRPPQ